MTRCFFLVLLAGYIAISAGPASAQSDDDLPKLRPIRTEIPLTYWERKGKALTLHLVEFTGWLGFSAWLLLRARPALPEPIEIRARRELERLRSEPDNEKTLSAISRCLRAYVIGAFGLPVEESTTTEFNRLLAGDPRVGLSLAERLSQFLQRCDVAKFSGANDLPLRSVLAEAMQLLERGEMRRAELRDAERGDRPDA